MARTYAAVEIDKDAEPRGWNLVCQGKQPLRKLREGGFYANFDSIEELKAHCIKLSNFSIKPPSSDEHASSIGGRTENLDEESKQPQPSMASKQFTTADSTGVDDKCREGQPSLIGVFKSLPKRHHLNLKHPTSENAINTVGSVEVTDCRISSEMAKLSGGSRHVSDQLRLSEGGDSESNSKPVTFKQERKGEVQSKLASSDNSDTEPVLFKGAKPIQLSSDTSDTEPVSFKRSKAVQMQTRPGISDDSDNEPVCFKRPRKGTSSLLNVENTQLAVFKCDSSQSLPDYASDHEPLIWKRPRKLGKRKLETYELSDEEIDAMQGHDSYEVEIDHESLSSRISKLVAHRQMMPSFKRTDFGHGEILIKQHQASLAGNEAIFGRRPPPIVDTGEHAARDNESGDSIFQQQSNDEVLPKGTSSREENTSNVSESERCVRDSLGFMHVAGGTDDVDENEIKCTVETIMKTSLKELGADPDSMKDTYRSAPVSTLCKLQSTMLAGLQALRCLDEKRSSIDAKTIEEYEKYKAELEAYDVGHFLPSVDRQKEVAERINCYVQDGDTLVEVRSRANDFFALIKERLSKSGKKCDYRIYAINLPEAPEKFPTIEDWLKMKKEDLPTGSNLVMCFSPAFELWGESVDRLFDHALELKPKLIVSIIPLLTRRLEVERNYDLVWEDHELLKNEVLWPWGLFDVPDCVLDEHSGVPPSMYLWSRSDWTRKHRQVAHQFSHVPKGSVGNEARTSFVTHMVTVTKTKENLNSTTGSLKSYNPCLNNEYNVFLPGSNFICAFAMV